MLWTIWVAGCRPETAVLETAVNETPITQLSTAATPMTAVPGVAPQPYPPKANDSLLSAVNAPPTLTPYPTSTQTPTPLPTATPLPTPTPTPIGPCDERMPADDLFTIVTLTYGLSRHYQPDDLVLLTDYLPPDVTLGYPTEVREIILEPLIQLISAMHAAGLQPQIISGYRSYAAQAIAWDKWLREEPERASILSAPPGHSEHQLGVTIDFGSPELPDLVGIEDIQFHTYFYMTSEGVWLAQNAHRYGFTLSYPRGALEISGFYYEPWHFRYIGVETATMLYETGLFLTEYQLLNQPEPCLP
jgi:D-alanyl-D-alanine carboxypeptidase